MTQEEYLRVNPKAAIPTFCGEQADRGRIVVGEEYPGEGYAILRCGNTEVKISYTVLSNASVKIDGDSHVLRDLIALQKAMHAVTCEASLGRTGDSDSNGTL